MLSRTEMTLSPASTDAFRVWLLGKGRAENTAKAYTDDLKEFLRASGGEEIERLEYEELAASWLVMNRNKVSPKTTGRRLTSLRAFAEWIELGPVLKDFIAPKPGKAIPHPIPEGLAGIERLLDAARNPEQCALIGLCGHAGLRISEARGIMVANFDLHSMMLTVRGKGDKTRVVPISKRAWSATSEAYLNAACNGDPHLIHYKDRSARYVVTSLGKKAQLKRPISSHDLRATFATLAYDYTRDIRVVQELLGHSSTETTQLYTGISEEKLRNAVNY
jgi:site-specific recombinase XerD